VLVALFEIVGVNNLLRIQKQQFYEKELSESTDKRYLFFNNNLGFAAVLLS
jgi:hypothetical protein